MSKRKLLVSAYMFGAMTIIHAFLVGYIGSKGIQPLAAGVVNAGTFVFAAVAVVQLCRYLASKQ